MAFSLIFQRTISQSKDEVSLGIVKSNQSDLRIFSSCSYTALAWTFALTFPPLHLNSDDMAASMSILRSYTSRLIWTIWMTHSDRWSGGHKTDGGFFIFLLLASPFSSFLLSSLAKRYHLLIIYKHYTDAFLNLPTARSFLLSFHHWSITLWQ